MFWLKISCFLDTKMAAICLDILKVSLQSGLEHNGLTFTNERNMILIFWNVNMIHMKRINVTYPWLAET